jgi:hypothetical protein
METRGPKLEWLALFMLLPLMMILGYLEVQLPISQTGHILVQLAILALIGFLANSWISANELGLRRSQYTHKSSQEARRTDAQPEEQIETQKQSDNKHPGWFARLGALLKPMIRRS